MKVKELIELLQKQDPEKPVYIQQGEQYAYMFAYTVKETKIYDAEDYDTLMDVVVIEYV